MYLLHNLYAILQKFIKDTNNKMKVDKIKRATHLGYLLFLQLLLINKIQFCILTIEFQFL